MKIKDYFFIVLIIFIYWRLSIQQMSIEETIIIKLDFIQQSIEERTHIDSLYWNHLEQCAFELREGIEYER